MCGFAGVITAPGGVPVSEPVLSAMQHSLSSRGPDGSGRFRQGPVALVHRRLAIRDSVGGEQPLVSGDGSCVLVYNGELYNDSQLREELAALGYRFRTKCDSETVLAAWMAWGPQFASRLDGMFALAIYDFRTRQLVLLRDRFGLKPLYFARLSRGIAFASSLPALRLHPGLGIAPDWASLSHYLTSFRLTLGSRTLFQGISQLQPATMLIRSEDAAGGEPREELQRYWEYPTDIDHSLDYEAAEHLLQDRLTSAVGRQLVSDRPVGMLLSGGVDSGTIAAIAREQSAGIRASCSGAGDLDPGGELDSARQCAAATGLEYDEVRLNAADYYDTWQWLLERGGTPLSTPSDVMLHQLARRLKGSVAVALSGEGADELLCGYAVQHQSPADYAVLRGSAGQPDSRRLQAICVAGQVTPQAGPAEFYLAMNSLVPLSGKPLLLRPDVWQAADEDHSLRQWYSSWFPSAEAGDYAAQHDRLLHRVNLEGQLNRLDTATMAAGLEVRAPFTDHQLVEAMFRVPRQFRIQVAPEAPAEGLTAAELHRRGLLHEKRLLRSLAAKLLPSSLAHRPKASFPTPVQQWLGTTWARRVRTALLSSPFARAVFNPQAIDELTAAPVRAGMWLWPLINLARWGDDLWWPRRDWLPAPHISVSQQTTVAPAAD
ncbi:MAG: asparagine synthase (glutamine-hydrolyzing) [Planctomycetaceae bacterium]|nr:asparagine synthase (glutamine-hydrolyzing) [Planctomycetaceae bacterium]